MAGQSLYDWLNVPPGGWQGNTGGGSAGGGTSWWQQLFGGGPGSWWGGGGNTGGGGGTQPPPDPGDGSSVGVPPAGNVNTSPWHTLFWNLPESRRRAVFNKMAGGDPVKLLDIEELANRYRLSGVSGQTVQGY